MAALYDPESRESRLLMPQEGVRQFCLPKKTRHCASWDSFLTKKGELYFSLCSELTTSEYAKLARYDADGNTVTECFRAEDVILPHERFIRDSKFHTSIAERPDGTLLMTTHTTDRAPGHPAWMPEAYYASPWEGFPGSTLISFDPGSGKAENLGIPAPRESIYGAAYDPMEDCYYMLGFLRGHLYRYECTRRRVADMGQAVERGIYKLVAGPDGNLYFSTRSGYLRRIDVRGKRVEDLGILLPNSCASRKLARSYLCAAACGPDGRLYIAGQFHDELSAFDPRTGKLEVLGGVADGDRFMEGFPCNSYVSAMAFDAGGCLWYAVNCLRHDRKEDFKPPVVLMRWKIGEEHAPVRMGLAGTPERAITTASGLWIDKKRDRMFMVGTNHADEGPDVTAVDLKEFREAPPMSGPECRDPYILPGNGLFERHAAQLAETWSILDANPASARFRSIVPIRLWNTPGDFDHEDCGVTALSWEGSVLTGTFGGKSRFRFRADRDGKLLSLEPDRGTAAQVPSAAQIPDLPYYPGRQYRATAELCCALSDGRKLVATADGLLALTDGNDVFALGPVCTSGPVRAMAPTPDRGTVYGVAGDEDDLGCVFRFDLRRGLRVLGRLATDGYRYGNAASCELSAAAVSDDGGVLAIGSADKLAAVYLCALDEPGAGS